jgi:DNA repair ATPase RecN
MRLDLTESLHEIEEEISDLNDTLEFSGIAAQILNDDETLTSYPAIRRWLETVSNTSDLERDLEELSQERDEIVTALEHLDQRFKGSKEP